MQDKAKRYSSTKYSLALIDTLYLLAMLSLFQGLGISGWLSDKFSFLPVYVFVVSLLYYILNFPLNFYSSFILEHKFSLSVQKPSDWFKDQFKAGAVFYIITLILLSAFYYILRRYPQNWWLITGLSWVFFSIILARLTPVVIIPLFFKYKRLSDDALRERILRLAEKMKVKVLDVFEIDFSKKTLKANAAFVGMGKTKRVILADTLKNKYSPEEIEIVLAHEFAHYRGKHLLRLILANALSTLLFFWLVFKTSSFALSFFSLASLSSLTAFPLLAAYMVIFEIIAQPLKNYYSRCLEKNADKEAIKITGLKDAFISTMDKLASQNLSDRSPHPLIKFFFFDHPPVSERIKLAQV